MNDVVITNIDLSESLIIISYQGIEELEAWLENKNKHYPHILLVDVDCKHSCIIVEKKQLNKFIEKHPGHIFKLSLSSLYKRLDYRIFKQIKNFDFDDITLAFDGGFICFQGKESRTLNVHVDEFHLDIHHTNKEKFENISQLPIEILNIGSCFSRSIFKSDEYFNPSYKKYFTVKKTLFHNSFISLFSDKIDQNYSSFDDLMTGDAGKYVGIEFEKNVKELFKNNQFQMVVVDNYIDATTPIIRFKNNAYLTYNKYFSESIFKRFFSSCEIIYPGSEKYLEFYKKSIVRFHSLIKEFNIKNVVLIGGRLSMYKFDAKSYKTSMWDDKMEWIVSSNKNWDCVDQIFLNEISSSIYLDKRNTFWMSDCCSPIIGGSSPSHYQSGFYKELFDNLLQFI